MKTQRFFYFIAIFSMIFFCSTASFAHSNDKAFEQAIKQSSFKVKVSSKNLSNMHEASTILIDCVDFRLRDETERLMRKHLKLLDNYDEITIPGASLAMDSKKYSHWKKTTHEVISILKSIHNIKRIIFLDHRECGAYKLILGKDKLDTREKETAAHKKMLKKAKADIKKTFPDLEVYTLLIGLDGEVENFTQE